MNIIANSCVGAFLTRDYLKEEFSNPFVWSYIDNKSFYNLIKNYDNINWFNYELIKDNNWNFSIIIDKQIKVDYPHYKFDINATKLTYFDEDKQNRNVYSNKIWEYIIEKYEERTKRMLNKNEKPLFLLATCYDFNIKDYNHHYDIEWINNIDLLETKYKVILVSKHFKFKNKLCYIYKHSKDNIELANEIYKMKII